MDQSWVRTTPLAMVLVFICGAPGMAQTMNQAPATEATGPFSVCGADSPRAYVLPTKPVPLRAVLEFPNGKRITVQTSIPDPVGTDEWVRARFDYRIVIGNIGPQFHITMFGGTADEKENLAHRFLDSVGVSCFPGGDAIVYFSFTVNGSDRDNVYVGLRLNIGTIPILVGRSEYGVLVLDRNDASRFSIWDSSEWTAPNAMGPHDYKVTEYQWNPGRISVVAVGKHDAGVDYPGNILYGPYLMSIRVGDPPSKGKRE